MSPERSDKPTESCCVDMLPAADVPPIENVSTRVNDGNEYTEVGLRSYFNNCSRHRVPGWGGGAQYPRDDPRWAESARSRSMNSSGALKATWSQSRSATWLDERLLIDDNDVGHPVEKESGAKERLSDSTSQPVPVTRDSPTCSPLSYLGRFHSESFPSENFQTDELNDNFFTQSLNYVLDDFIPDNFSMSQLPSEDRCSHPFSQTFSDSFTRPNSDVASELSESQLCPLRSSSFEHARNNDDTFEGSKLVFHATTASDLSDERVTFIADEPFESNLSNGGYKNLHSARDTSDTPLTPAYRDWQGDEITSKTPDCKSLRPRPLFVPTSKLKSRLSRRGYRDRGSVAQMPEDLYPQLSHDDTVSADHTQCAHCERTNYRMTTVMLRNIPNKYTQRMLLDVINASYETRIDFFYLPIDFKNECNVGYAFINFTHSHYACQFKYEFGGRKLGAFNSNKVCEVSWGRVQGVQANIEHHRASAVLSVAEEEYRPLLINQSGCLVPFPAERPPSQYPGAKMSC